MKMRKILIPLAIILCIVGIFVWHQRELNFPDLIPQENWVRAEVWLGEPGVGDQEVALSDLSALLDAFEDTTVTRGPESSGYTVPYFKIMLYKGEPYPTLISVGENGRIAVAKELDLDHYAYYKGGEELYQALLALTAAP